MRKILVASVLSIIITSPVLAMDAPLFSLQRVSIAAGMDYAKSNDAIGKNLAQAWEFKPSGNAAYNLGHYVSLSGSIARGVKSKNYEYRVGVRLHLYRGAK